MHIRDEPLRDETKDRMKRRFEALGANKTTTSSAAPPQPAFVPEASTMIVLPTVPQESPDGPSKSEDTVIPLEIDPSQGNTFRSKAARHSVMVDLDDQDN